MRRTVVGGALAVFIAVWVWLAAQMAAGNDPVLSAKRQPPKPQSATQPQIVQTPEGLVVVPAQSQPTTTAQPPATTHSS